MHKNDFAPIPPMGWDSYDYYGTSINETQVKSGAHYPLFCSNKYSILA